MRLKLQSLQQGILMHRGFRLFYKKIEGEEAVDASAEGVYSSAFLKCLGGLETLNLSPIAQ
jgi:hypothetical protein